MNTKQKFKTLLDRAISSQSMPQKQAKSGGYSGKRTHQRNVGGILPKRRDKSRPKSV